MNPQDGVLIALLKKRINGQAQSEYQAKLTEITHNKV